MPSQETREVTGIYIPCTATPIPQKSENKQGVVVAYISVPVLGRPRQMDLCEFETSLVYRMNSGIARAR